MNENHFRAPNHPRISDFVRAMIKEDEHWKTVVEDYVNSPADGIRGKGQGRRQDYMEQDENIRQICMSRGDYHPLEFLKAIACRMPDPLIA
jgi:hypothetical protein